MTYSVSLVQPLQHIKVELRKRTRRYIQLAQDRFDRKFITPYIEIVKDSPYAGSALHLWWTVQLDEGLLRTHYDEMLEVALPHEIAHLLDMKLNLKVYAAMQRIPHHGYGWKSLMKTFGIQTPLTTFAV